MSSTEKKISSGVPGLVAQMAEVGDVFTVVALGSTKTDAAPLPALGDSFAVTGADGTKGVILTDRSLTSSARVFNFAAAILKIYPPSGHQINNLTADNPISLAANAGGIFHKLSATGWGLA